MRWLLFQYGVPNKPSKLRVYVWRKLKALRVEQLTEGMYALPLTVKTTEQLEWLSAEVLEMGGTAAMWRAECLSERQEQALVTRFQERAAQDYERIQQQLAQTPEADRDIVRQYADIRYHDYFEVWQHHTIHAQIERHYRRGKDRSETE